MASCEDEIRRIVEVERKQGIEAGRALAKYQGVTSLTRPQAMEILEIIWPKAPALEKTAAAMLCATYHLNPLAGHVFLIKFNRYKDGKVIGEDWARIMGIKATRLIASRFGAYSYLDFSPRLMADEEQIKVWGKVDKDNVCFVTILEDRKTGSRVYGYGKWPGNTEPYGTDKGNSKENMAGIRSERQALDRLRPGEMPGNIDVVDESYAGEYHISEAEPEPEVRQEEAKVEPEEQTEGKIDMPWLIASVNSLKWDILQYIRDKYHVETTGNLGDAVGQLSKEQRAELCQEVQERLDKSQSEGRLL